MDESTRIILSRRFAELDRAFEVSDKNVDKIIQIIATKAGKRPADVKRNAEIAKSNAVQRKLRRRMVDSLRQSMVRSLDVAPTI